MAQVSNVRKGPAKVETPSENIARTANPLREITDALGRKLVAKRPGALDKMRLFKVIGGENSQNQMYMGYAMLAISTVSIDGDPIDPCTSVRDVEGLVQRLGDEGIEAIGEAFAEDGDVSQKELVEAARNFT